MSAWSDANSEVIWRRLQGKVTQITRWSDANWKCFRGEWKLVSCKPLAYNELQKSFIFAVFPTSGHFILKYASIAPLKFEVFLTKPMPQSGSAFPIIMTSPRTCHTWWVHTTDSTIENSWWLVKRGIFEWNVEFLTVKIVLNNAFVILIRCFIRTFANALCPPPMQ